MNRFSFSGSVRSLRDSCEVSISQATFEYRSEPNLSAVELATQPARLEAAEAEAPFPIATGPARYRSC